MSLPTKGGQEDYPLKLYEAFLAGKIEHLLPPARMCNQWDFFIKFSSFEIATIFPASHKYDILTVGYLSLHQIRPVFEEHGNVVEVVILKDKRTGQQQGIVMLFLWRFLIYYYPFSGPLNGSPWYQSANFSYSFTFIIYLPCCTINKVEDDLRTFNQIFIW